MVVILISALTHKISEQYAFSNSETTIRKLEYKPTAGWLKIVIVVFPDLELDTGTPHQTWNWTGRPPPHRTWDWTGGTPHRTWDWTGDPPPDLTLDRGTPPDL